MIRSVNYIKKFYEKHSVACTGMKGSGKDMLTTNVIARRKLPYCSNVPCGGDFYPLDFRKILPKDSWRNFLLGLVHPYAFPLPEYCDIYLSDAGVYLPAQYCNEINKEYPTMATYLAISRHLNNGKFHFNCQNLNRVYDKIREMCDVYLFSEWCKVFFGKIVFQSVIIYDKAESCQARIRPPRVTRKGLVPSREAETQREIYLDNFYNSHGRVERVFLVYINKSQYDTRYFKSLLGG